MAQQMDTRSLLAQADVKFSPSVSFFLGIWCRVEVKSPVIKPATFHWDFLKPACQYAPTLSLRGKKIPYAATSMVSVQAAVNEAVQGIPVSIFTSG